MAIEVRQSITLSIITPVKVVKEKSIETEVPISILENICKDNAYLDASGKLDVMGAIRDLRKLVSVPWVDPSGNWDGEATKEIGLKDAKDIIERYWSFHNGN